MRRPWQSSAICSVDEMPRGFNGAEIVQIVVLARGEAVPHAQVAVELGMTEGAIKVAALRLRRRFGELIRAEVARTVNGPEEVDEEIRDLFAALAL